jgi:hypothetical protein
MRRAIVYVYAPFPELAYLSYPALALRASHWAEKNEFSVLRSVLDIGVRDELRRAIQDVANGSVEAIAVAHVGTFGEDLGSVVMEALYQTGGILLSAREHIMASTRVSS